MKRILLFALVAMFSLSAGARTLYVDASRPNNKGNGLKAATAKKTIQAAINAAKPGDTIIVLPGTYSAISTKNRKITIKAKSGAAKTTIKKASSPKADAAIAKLGKPWMEDVRYIDKNGKVKYVAESTGNRTKGTSTTLAGFTLDGTKAQDWENLIGVSGGTVKSCIVKNVAGNRTVYRSKLVGCTLRDNDYLSLEQATLSRCKLLYNKGYTWYNKTQSSKFVNCLMAVNDTFPMTGCTLVNCTVADNSVFRMSNTKAWNTIFSGVAKSQFKSKKKNTLTTCYKGANPKFVSGKTTESVWVPSAAGKETINVPIQVWIPDIVEIPVTNWISADLSSGYSESADWNTFWTYTHYLDGSGTEKPFDDLDKAKLQYDDDSGMYYYPTKLEGHIYYYDQAKAEWGYWAEGEPIIEDHGRWVEDTQPQTGDHVSTLKAGNYHLQKGSPCINKGTKAAAVKKLFGSKDLDGKKRIKGKTVDIGCYEY